VVKPCATSSRFLQFCHALVWGDISLCWKRGRHFRLNLSGVTRHTLPVCGFVTYSVELAFLRNPVATFEWTGDDGAQHLRREVSWSRHRRVEKLLLISSENIDNEAAVAWSKWERPRWITRQSRWQIFVAANAKWKEVATSQISRSSHLWTRTVLFRVWKTLSNVFDNVEMPSVKWQGVRPTLSKPGVRERQYD